MKPITIGTFIKNELNKLNIDYLNFNSSRSTIIKERFITNNKQLLRVDTESIVTPDFDFDILKIFIERNNINKIIVSDYNKGLISNNLWEFLCSLNIPLFVDVKKSDIHFYKNTFLIKMNRNEFKQFYGKLIDFNHQDELNLAIEFFKSKTNCNNIVITLDRDGSILYTNDTFYRCNKYIKDVVDVSGAGDTFLTVISNYSDNLVFAHELANKAASIVVSKSGTYPISKFELFDENDIVSRIN